MPNAFRQGDHVCSICDSEEERLTTAAAFLADGITRGERLVYVGENPDALRRFREALAAAGLDAAALSQRGALIELTHEEFYLAGGRFEFERTMTIVSQAIAQALADGFSGLRACGDMSWLLAGAAGSERIEDYESRLNPLFASSRACAMCQYDRSRLPPHLVDMALVTHSTAVVAGQQHFNPFYQNVASGGEERRRPADRAV